MPERIVGPKDHEGADRRPRREASVSHPIWKANLLMVGVVILLVVVSVVSAMGG